MAAVASSPSSPVFQDSLSALGGGDFPPPPPSARVAYAHIALPPPANIMVARPLLELASHISHRMCPSWQLIARCIKVVVLALFRGHFCDHVFLLNRVEEEQRNPRAFATIQHSLEGAITQSNPALFTTIYLFMLEQAIELRLNRSVTISPARQQISPFYEDQPIYLVGLSEHSDSPIIQQSMHKRSESVIFKASTGLL